MRRGLAVGVASSLAVASYGLPAFADVNTVPTDPAEAAASIIMANLMDSELAGGGTSRATFPTSPGPDSGALDVSLLGNELAQLPDIGLPLDGVIDFGQLGALLSESEATDPINARAISGIAGGDGSVTLDGEDADFGVATIDLLSLFETVGMTGLTDAVVDQATLELGAGGAYVEAVDGVFQDPDGVGGLGQYRVAEISAYIHSLLIEQAAGQMYDAIGNFETQIRDAINGIMAPLAALGATVTINSNIQEEVFNELLQQPICSSVMIDPATGENVCDTENTILEVNFGDGTAVIHLDNIMDGERPDDPTRPTGINNQDPNTELIDDELYPMIAESVHDVMNAALNIAAGAVENALNSVTIDITFSQSVPLLGTASKTFTMGLNGEYTESACVGGAACTALETALIPVRAALDTAGPLLAELLNNGAQQIFDLAIGTVKTDLITVTVRSALEPFIEMLAQVVSLQINHQVQQTCVLPDGTTTTGSLEVSALSLGLLQGTGVDGAARLGLGNAGVRIDACGEFAAITPAITVDPATVPAGTSTFVDGTGFTANGEVSCQLVDAAGNPVGSPITTTADAEGNFLDAELPIAADVAPGDYTVVCTDVTTGITAEAPVAVTAVVQNLNIGLDPPAVPAGEPTTITGSGYTPNGPVTCQLTDASGAPVGDPLAVTAGADGTFTAELLVPADAVPGDYTVVCTDDTTGNSAEAPLTVLDPADPTPGQIGDFVWDDTNANGLQDAGEPGVPNVPVTLTDAAGAEVGTTTTDANGVYSFADLPVGDYTITFTAPAGQTFTTPDAGDDALDSDVDPTTGSAPVSLTDAAPVTDSVDAGLVPADAPTGSIGDFVWDDTNANGLQDAGEPGVPGVTVTLLDPTGVTVGSTTTDAAGNYSFTDIPLGDYTVTFVAPAGQTFTTPDAGDDALDSDVDPTTGSVLVSLTEAAPALDNIDAGLVPVTGPLGSIGDFVWDDTNANGLQDAGEPGVPGVTVTLTDANGVEFGTTTTDAAGAYSFTDVPVGEYTVTFTAPEGQTFTTPDAGDDTLDSDVDPLTGSAPASVTVDVPNSDTVDAGLVPAEGPLGSLGDFVWSDLNGDGLQSAGEPGVSGVTVTLLDASGAEVASTTTDTAGNYSFVNLPLGDYTVSFTAPAGQTFTTPDAGDDTMDSDVDPTTGSTPVVSLTAAVPDNTTVDAGLVPVVEVPVGVIGDFVWSDLNGDGLQGADEPGVAGVTVTLLDATGATVSSTTTDAAGAYSFAELPFGDYTVTFVAPAGQAFTVADAGDDALDSDAAENGTTPVVTLTAEAPANLTVDAGLVEAPVVVDPALVNDPASVPAGEPTTTTGTGYTPNSTVTVQLVDPAGNPVGDPITVPTDETGGFTTQVPVPADAVPGEYTVVGTDDTTGTPAEAPLTITEATGEVLGSIGDFVWQDTNENGLQDAGEPGVAGVTVTLTDASGAEAGTTTTDVDGAYLFSGLSLGDYTVTFTAPAGQAFTVADAGDDAVDSDADPATGATPVVTLTEAAADVLTVDAGLVEAPAVVDPTIVADPVAAAPGETTTATGEGYTPNGEATVELVDPDGNVLVTVEPVVVDENGAIAPTEVTVPESATPSAAYQIIGTDITSGLSATTPFEVTDPAAGIDPVITVDPSEVAPGESTTVTGGGFTPNSPVEVQLTDPAGNPVGDPITVTTDENGNFTVDVPVPADAVPGDYSVVATDEATGTPAEAPLTVTEATAPVITVDPSEVAPGESTTVTGGGFTPNSPVEVQLTDPSGNPVGDPITVTTDENGNFTVDVPVPADAVPGDYSVVATDEATGTPAEAPLTVTDPAAVVDPTIVADPIAAAPGETTTATGEGYTPNGEATVELVDPDGNVLVTVEPVVVDENGAIAPTEITVPESATPSAAYQIIGLDIASGYSATTPFQVLAATDPGEIDPAVTADPSEVAPGESTDVTGTGYSPNSLVSVQLVDPSGNPVGDPIVVTTDENGAFGPEELIVPEGTEPGEYAIVATDGPTGTSAETPLTVTEPTTPVVDPTIVADPIAAAPGETTTATGEGYTPNGEASVQLVDPDGNVLVTVEPVVVDENGAIAPTEITVPESATPSAAYQIIGLDIASGYSATTPFQVLAATDPGAVDPALTADPSEVAPGETTTASGTGYSPNSLVSVQLVDPAGNPVGDPIIVTTDENGNFTTPVTVPEGAAPGEYKIIGTDGPTGTPAEALLLVTEAAASELTIVADPEAAAPGETTTVTGEGYTPDSAVVVTLEDADGNVIATVNTTADANGAISVELTVPATATEGADYTIRATDSETDRSATTPFEVLALVCEAPILTTSPTAGQPGTTVTVDGACFTPGETVVVEIIDADGNVIAEVEVVADEDGNFTTEIVVPEDAVPGDHTIRGTDESGQSAEAPFEVTPVADPSTPGAPGKDGKDGKDGVNGKDGKDGKDGKILQPIGKGKGGKNGGSLANTGTATAAFASLAVLMVLGGAALLVANRKRKGFGQR